MTGIPQPPYTSITNDLLYAILMGLPYDDTLVKMFSTTEELLYAILKKGLMSGYYIGAKNVIETADAITVPENYQYIVFRDMKIDGALTVNGEIVIL